MADLETRSETDEARARMAMAVGRLHPGQYHLVRAGLIMLDEDRSGYAVPAQPCYPSIKRLIGFLR